MFEDGVSSDVVGSKIQYFQMISLAILLSLVLAANRTVALTRLLLVVLIELLVNYHNAVLGLSARVCSLSVRTIGLID